MEAKSFATRYEGKEAIGITIEGKAYFLIGDPSAEDVAEKIVQLWNSQEKTRARNGSKLPRSAEEAADRGVICGVDPEFAKQVYHQLDGRNWIDGAGNTIYNFNSHLTYRWMRERAKWFEQQAAAKEGGKESVWAIKQRLEAVRDQLRPYTDEDHLKYDSLRGPDGKLTPENYANLQMLRSIEKKLRSKLTGV